MTTEPSATGNGHSRKRPPRDAAAGGGPPVTGDHFAGDGEGTIMRAFLRAGGLSKEEVRRRPIIGICSSYSELNPCNMGLRDLAEAVRRGVTAAGGTAVVFPTISLNENMLKPTSMLLRNLMSMDVEEMIRCSPIDGVVLLAGRDDQRGVALVRRDQAAQGVSGARAGVQIYQRRLASGLREPVGHGQH